MFCNFDFRSGFCPVDVGENSGSRTVLATRDEPKRYVENPFGLKNALEASEQAMNDTLFPVKLQFFIAYIHIVAVFLHSRNDHINHVKQALLLVQNAGTTLIQIEPEYVTGMIYYVGHVIFPRRPMIAMHTANAID